MPTTRSSPRTPASGSRRKATPRRPAPRRPERSAVAADITNYTTACKWLFEHVDYERQRVVKYNKKSFSLDRMKRLLEELDSPHNLVPCVQIAGTKGKGSTSTMLASMLQATGCAVGLYTSPHLSDLRERIAVNGSMISYNDMAELIRRIAMIEEQHLADDPPTFFEILTAAALRHYADQAVDIAVLETGLGGRLDSTTAVTPLAIGITQISLDHTHLLGKTLPEIAREKAGTFKPGVPVFSAEQEKEVVKTLKEVAAEVDCPIKFVGKDIEFSLRFESNKELGPHTRVCLSTPTSRFEHLPVPLQGEHQAVNCGLALALLDHLKSRGFTLPDAKVIKGLAATELPGRMEEVWAQPRVIVDGAHNPASIQALIKALGAHVAYDSLVMIFGCGQDKEVDAMLQQVALGADKVIFTKADKNPRSMEPTELMHRILEEHGKMAQSGKNLEEAIRLAAKAVTRDDLIVITGSFYLVGEARKHFADLTAKRKKNGHNGTSSGHNSG